MKEQGEYFFNILTDLQDTYNSKMRDFKKGSEEVFKGKNGYWYIVKEGKVYTELIKGNEIILGADYFSFNYLLNLFIQVLNNDAKKWANILFNDNIDEAMKLLKGIKIEKEVAGTKYFVYETGIPSKDQEKLLESLLEKNSDLIHDIITTVDASL